MTLRARGERVSPMAQTRLRIVIADDHELMVAALRRVLSEQEDLEIVGRARSGDEVVPLVNRLARGFSHVVLTQDWHPRSHVSFAANHAGRQPFEFVTLPYGEQVLWPVH